MKKFTSSILSAVLTLILSITVSTVVNVPLVHAQDTGLCPAGFSQGIVDTGFVDCFDTSSSQSQRANAEADRLELEAICNSVPNSAVTSSQIMVTSSNRFFASVACRITRVVPIGTVLCPAGSDEVYRVFNTLVCENFGTAVATFTAAQAKAVEQTTACTGASGSIIDSSILEGMIPPDNASFFYATSTCLLVTAVVDGIHCPYAFDENFRTLNTLECEYKEGLFETMAEADAVKTAVGSICTDTTLSLGTVTDSFTAADSNGDFFIDVTCTLAIPRFSDFSGEDIVRACDATCTETIKQSRTCLNGGVIGGPGCFGKATQDVTQRCNTGVDRAGLCPLTITPVVTPLLLEEEDK